MSESPQKAKKLSKSGLIAVLLALIVVVLIVLVVLLMMKRDNTANDSDAVEQQQTVFQYMKDGKLMYDANVVAIDEDSLQQQVDEMFKKAEEGTMTLEFKNTAMSDDGIHFNCSINNAVENNYDMYINIYKDDTCQEQLLLTGLIPPGAGIRSFESEIQLDPGNYEALLVLTQVEDDHATLHAQLSVVLNLVVEDYK